MEDVMSVRKYVSEQKQMFGYQAEDRLPEGHICFLIDEIVDELELGPAARGNDVLGAPSYDPRMMVKVLFYGYSRVIRSSRKLAAECRENIGFMKLCQGEAPDFRTIALFRRENGPLLERGLSELIRRLVEAGVVSGSHVIVDGTKVRANANNSKTIHERFFEEVKEAVEDWMRASASLDKEEEVREKLSSAGVGTSGKSRGIDSLQRLVDKCSKAVEEGETGEAKKVSLTDPESRFMRDGATGKVALSYNVQVAVDAESGIMVACDVTEDAVDNRSLCRLVDQVEKNACEAVEAVDGDSGFFEMEQIRRLEGDGKDVCVADSETVSAMRKGRLSEFIEGEKFSYDSGRDVFACRFGNEHVLKRVCARKGGRVSRVYEAVRPCDGCPGRQECLGQSRNRFHKLERTVDHPWLHKYRERFLESGYQERLRGRKLIEHNFGHLKHNLDIRRFLLRGLLGARIEAFLGACASVLRRLCTILKREARSWGSLIRRPELVGPRPV
jgi:transposase